MYTMFSQLPTELIQLILWNCETPAFFQLAQTNRRLYKIAQNSREAILHQLHHTPGWVDDDIHSNPISDLYTLLRCRSNAQLDGAEYRARFSTYGFSDQVLDTQASVLMDNRALLVFKNHSTVYLVKIKDGKLTREAQWESPGQAIGEVEIIQTAFHKDHGVYVLHRYKPFPDQDLDTDHPFVQHALESHSDGEIFLACHDLNTENKTVCMTAFPAHQDYNPLALAVTDDQFAISWQHRQDPSDYEVVLYQNLNKETAEGDPEQGEATDCKITYVTYRISSLANSSDHPIPGAKGPAVNLAFNDRGFQLLYQYRAQPLYGSFTALHHHRKPSQANQSNVSFTPSLSLQFAIDIPFFATHSDGDRPTGTPCHWQYLALGIARHRAENWTVACLLKSEAFPLRRCTHVFNLDRGRRFENWTVMAQLGDFQQSTTSHGSQVATSRCGTRIAVADWKTLYVWALDPYEVLDPESQFYPPSWKSSAGTPVLRPVILSLGAVCSQLQFTKKEHELIAITDRGMVYVNLNANGPGERNEEDRHDIIFGAHDP